LSYKRQAASKTRHVDGARNGLQLGFPAIPMFVETSIAITQLHKKSEDFFLFPNRKISSSVALKTSFCCSSASTYLYRPHFAEL
jgi:hypothetical protein